LSKKKFQQLNSEHSKVKYELFSMTLCNNLLPNYQNLCPECTQCPRHDGTDDSGINDQLIKMHSTYSWINMCFKLID